MPLIHNKAEFQSDIGKTVSGSVLSCSCQVNLPGLFLVFQLEKQTHHHLRCAKCGMSYCHEDSCRSAFDDKEDKLE